MSSALLADGAAPAAPAATVPPRGTRRATRKRLLLAAAGLAALAGLAWYGVDYWQTGRFIESTDDAYVGGDVTDLAPQVGGLIAAVLVTDNQAVRQGQLLVKLDDRDYRAALAKAQAAVVGDAAARANLDATQTLQMALIAQAAAGVASARSQIALTEANERRYRSLAATAAGSVQQSQTADAGYQQAVAELGKAAAGLSAAQAQLGVIATEKQQAEAALAGATAARDMARLDLGYTEIRAPLDGTVGDRSAHAGAYAMVGAQLLSIVPAHGLWVDANFKEDQLAAMRQGQVVRIVADVLPGRRITGHVATLAPATGAVFSVLPAENATGNFTKIVQRVPVRILLDGGASALGLLRPGLSVTASVDTR